MANNATQVVTQVPSELNQLARLIARGFYGVEDALVIDMLVRNPCIRDTDLQQLLKFDMKMLRARITSLKNDKLVQVRTKMETGTEGRATKVNYYFINYKIFVNVVKYKLDMMRKKMETQERTATSRASWVCPNCFKTFTDLEADQIYDRMTNDFKCTYCNVVLDEDQSGSQKDSKSMIARFNSLFEPVYVLLSKMENVTLSPELLEPEPVDLSAILNRDSKNSTNKLGDWSGEATRHRATEETKVDITIGDEDNNKNKINQKEAPIWLRESTIIDAESQKATSILLDDNSNSNPPPSSLMATSQASTLSSGAGVSGASNKNADDIMSVLLQHEKRGNTSSQANLAAAAAALKQTVPAAAPAVAPEESDDSDDEEPDKMGVPNFLNTFNDNATSININAGGDNDEDDDDDDIPMVTVGDRRIPLDEVDQSIISQMTPEEKDRYIKLYQSQYSDIYD